MILNTPFARTPYILTTFLQIVIMIVQVLIPKVVNIKIPKLSVWVHFLRKIDDAVFDDVANDTTDMICLISTKNSIIAIHTFHPKLSQLIGFNHLASMFDKCILYREANPDLLFCFVVEVAFEFLELVVVGVVVVFKFIKLRRRDLHFLAADKLDGFVWMLVDAGIDVAFFVRGKLAFHYAFRGARAS
jgi:hypothetical protein